MFGGPRAAEGSGPGLRRDHVQFRWSMGAKWATEMQPVRASPWKKHTHTPNKPNQHPRGMSWAAEAPHHLQRRGESCIVVGDAVSVMLSSAFPGAVDLKCCVNGEVANSVESIWCEGYGGVTRV